MNDKFVAGWYDNDFFNRRYVFVSVEEVQKAFPEIFEIGMTAKEMFDRVYGEDGINSEGNYHEFVFRLAWPWEK